MFEPLHFVWLAICALVIVGGTVLSLKKNLSLKGGLNIFCALCVASEVVKIFFVLIREERHNEYGVYIKETDLPFHLCSMQIFCAFIARFTKSERIREFFVRFMIPTGLFGGLAAILIPTITCSFANVRTYQYFLYHAGLSWFAIFAIYRKKDPLDVKAFLQVLAGLGVAMMIAIYINAVTQRTNFLYVAAPPMDGLPILNMDNGWLIYFLSYVAVVLVVLLLFFAPFWIYYAVKKRKIKK
ncbi:MAG: YwaF family protein [Clostridia bacterium]|nr:YwaF family protein [Clostridia bacterium]